MTDRNVDKKIEFLIETRCGKNRVLKYTPTAMGEGFRITYFMI